MSGTTSRALLRAWRSVPLPSLRQGGTLSIRGSSRGLPTPLSVRIVPEWRDDAVLSLEQTMAMPTHHRPPSPSPSLDDERDDLVGDGSEGMSSTEWLREVEARMEVKVDDEGVETSMGRRAPLASVIVGRRSTTMDSGTNKRRKSWAEMDLERNPDRCYGLANPQEEEHYDGGGGGDDEQAAWATEEDYPYHSYDHEEERRRRQNEPLSSPSSGSSPAGDSGLGGMDAGTSSSHPSCPGEATSRNSAPADPSLVLTAKVPEKLNVTCHLDGPGDSIRVTGKVEGDADLLTADGDISVTKLRGHSVRLSAGGGGIVHASKLIEAEKVELSAEGDRGRVRATMINGSDVSVHIRRGVGGRMAGCDDNTGVESSHQESRNDDSSTSSPLQKLDVDDQLASVDVGSLYTSRNGPGASVVVDRPPCGSACIGGGEGGGADGAWDVRTHPLGCGVRIKSNHGHVSVRCVAASAPETSVDEYGRDIPLVELGGVNGSCDVALVPSSSSSSSSEEDEGEGEGREGVRTTHHDDDNWEDEAAAATFPSLSSSFLAARVHFDSFSPNTVSLVTCDVAGDVELTLDRKAEAEVRLVSCPDASSLDIDAIVDDDDGEEKGTVRALLEHKDRIARSRSRNTPVLDTLPGAKRISVATSSLSARGGQTALADDGVVEYVSGFIENKSCEPDSRFDVKTKGERSVGAGKINVANAAEQALHGFSGSGPDHTEGRQQHPLLAVVTSAKILMETVSWFGAIARRYGMEDNRSSNEGESNPQSRRS